MPERASSAGSNWSRSRGETWWRSSAARQAGDTALIAIAFGIGLAGHLAARNDSDIEAGRIGVATAVGAACAAAILWWRRTHPALAFGGLLVVAAVVGAAEEPGLFTVQVAMEIMVLCHAAGAWSRRPRLTLVVLGILTGLAFVSAAADEDNSLATAGAFALALVAFPAVVGAASRARRQYLDEVEARLAAAERDRDERALRAIAEERTRIARELHDVVAHHVSLIGVQAGAARAALDRSPEATRAALGEIERSSRAAIAELGQLLGVLRPDSHDGDGLLAPQPGLERLDELVSRFEAAGYEVASEIQGRERALPPAWSLCAYRIIEEALTNVVRHSRASTVAVDVDLRSVVPSIIVRDPGPARDSSEPATERRGHVGMAERVALFGGTVRCIRTTDGGYEVLATIPLDPP